VRIRLDFVLVFDRELDSVPGARLSLVNDGISAWAREMKLEEEGATGIAPSARMSATLDFRKGGG
jgi:hypothetical protein